MKWLKNENDDLYDPSYVDMLRVAFVSQFSRGRLEELVALLSGRNFETREYEASIEEESYAKLKVGVEAFMNETNFKRFVMIIKSAGFVDSKLIRAQAPLNMAYTLYLKLRQGKYSQPDIEKFVRRWFVSVDINRTILGFARIEVRSRHQGDRPATVWGILRVY